MKKELCEFIETVWICIFSWIAQRPTAAPVATMKPQHQLLIVTIGFMIIGLAAAKGM